MKKLMDNLYDDLDKAKAFALSFTNMAYFYDDVSKWDFHIEICDECGKTRQSLDYLAPRANCKKPTAILHSLEPGVSQKVHDDLIEKFDITEADFRPVRSKRGEIVYYQITPQHVMLPIHEENEWPILKVCPKCGSIYYDRPIRKNRNGEPYFIISKTAAEDMHDVNVTYERFRRDYPLFVISKRVYDYLTDQYPRTHYFPFFQKEV